MATKKMKELSVGEGAAALVKYPCLESGARCGDFIKTRYGGYTCTLAAGHDGEHAAHIPGPSVIAVWGGK